MVALGEPRAVGDLQQATAEDPLDVVEDPLLGGEERVEAVLADELADPLLGRAEPGYPGAHVHLVQVRGPGVPKPDPLDVLADLEALDDLHGREERRLAETGPAHPRRSSQELGCRRRCHA